MQIYTIMEKLSQKRIDREFSLFATRHFEKPRKCRDLRQVQFYIRELSNRIEELKKNFNYVPDSAYALLADYSMIQKRYILDNFTRIYC